MEFTLPDYKHGSSFWAKKNLEFSNYDHEILRQLFSSLDYNYPYFNLDSMGNYKTKRE